MKNYKLSINRSLSVSSGTSRIIPTTSTRFALVNRRATSRATFALYLGLGVFAVSATVHAQDTDQAQDAATQGTQTEKSVTPAITPSAVTPPSTVTAPAVAPPAVTPPTVISSAAPANVTSSVASARAFGASSINVLLVPLDETDMAVAPVAASPTTNTSATTNAPKADVITTDANNVVKGATVSQAVGAAERAAAPLRRALISRGLGDVLSAAPDSPVLRRAVVEGRLSADVISDLRSGMKELAATTVVSDITSVTADVVTAPVGDAPVTTAIAATPTTAAENNVNTNASTAVGGDVTAPVTTNTLRSASISEVSGPRRKANEAAARIGRLLGYRAVVAFSVVNDASGTRVVFLLVDSVRETGVVVVPAMSTASGRAFSLATADTGSTLLQQQLQTWDAVSTTEKKQLIEGGETRARALMEAGELSAAREELNVALTSDPTRIDLYELLGDVLLKSGNAPAAIAAYRRVLDAQPEGQRGAMWTKIAQAYVGASNWPETLNAADQALLQKHDSLELRLAMAQAQIGRARLFEEAGRAESAYAALEDVENNLKKATEFSSSDTRIARLQVQQLTMQNRTREALMVLDRVAPQSPTDGELQAIYANSLLSRAGRESEAFTAWSLAWNALTKNGTQTKNAALPALPTPDRLRYRRLADGFDLVVGNAAKSVYALTERVLDGSMTREDALLKARAPLSQILAAGETLKALQPPDDRLRQSHLVRIEAAEKLTESVAAYSLFLESGEENYRDSAVEGHKKAISQLNSLRQNM